jgi:hypothetical protein
VQGTAIRWLDQPFGRASASAFASHRCARQPALQIRDVEGFRNGSCSAPSRQILKSPIIMGSASDYPDNAEGGGRLFAPWRNIGRGAGRQRASHPELMFE